MADQTNYVRLKIGYRSHVLRICGNSHSPLFDDVMTKTVKTCGRSFKESDLVNALEHYVLFG